MVVFSRVDANEFTPPWVPTNRFALSLEEIGYGHQLVVQIRHHFAFKNISCTPVQDMYNPNRCSRSQQPKAVTHALAPVKRGNDPVQ
jgi:hypothetical protein